VDTLQHGRADALRRVRGKGPTPPSETPRAPAAPVLFRCERALVKAQEELSIPRAEYKLGKVPVWARAQWDRAGRVRPFPSPAQHPLPPSLTYAPPADPFALGYGGWHVKYLFFGSRYKRNSKQSRTLRRIEQSRSRFATRSYFGW